MPGPELGFYDHQKGTRKRLAVHDVQEMLQQQIQFLEQAQREQAAGSPLDAEELVQAIAKRRELLLRELVPPAFDFLAKLERDCSPGLLARWFNTKKARLRQAFQLVREGFDWTAVEALSAALARDPQDLRVRLARALLYATNTPAEYDSAKRDIELVLLRHPGHPLAHLCLGAVSFALAEMEEAREHLERASAAGLPEFQAPAERLLALCG